MGDGVEVLGFGSFSRGADDGAGAAGAVDHHLRVRVGAAATEEAEDAVHL